MPVEKNPDAIRYGIVGLGRAGWGIHVTRLRDRPDARIVAVADPDPARCEKGTRELGARAYPRLAALLEDADVEVVVVATPSFAHCGDTLAAVAAGKHVLAEKPMGVNLEEARRMTLAADDAGRHLFVHHQLRFSPLFTHLHEVATSGIIGQVFHIRINVQSFVRRNDWQTLQKNGGGVLNNTCTHYLDLSLQLVGAPIVEAFADLKQIAAAGDTEDHVKALLRAENGATIDLEVSRAEEIKPELPKWILAGTCGTLTSDGKTSRLASFDPEKAPPLEAIDAPSPGREFDHKDALPWQIEERPAIGPDVGGFYDQVYDVVRHGAAMRVTPESVCEVMRVVELIRASAAKSGWKTPVLARV